MKISVRNLEPTKVKLTVTVDPEEFNPYLDNARKEIAKQVNVPGFRKGHVPGKIIDQRIGFGAVAGEAVNNGVPELYSKALEEKGIRPMAQPEIVVQEVPESAKDETKLKFVATVERRPDIELPEIDAQNGSESNGVYQTPDSGRQSYPGSPCWPCAWPARREHHGVHEGIQRAHAEGYRLPDSCRHYGLCGPFLQLHHQDAPGGCPYQEGCRYRERFRRAQQDEGRVHHEEAAGGDRQHQNARPERGEPGDGHQHDRRHLPQHGRYGHRLTVRITTLPLVGGSFRITTGGYYESR